MSVFRTCPSISLMIEKYLTLFLFLLIMTFDECGILDIINQKFGYNLEPTAEFCRIDGIDENKKIVCEIKTRTCRKDTYPDTMIGLDKIQFCKEIYNDFQLLLVFQFVDGLFYYIYSESDNHRTNLGGRVDRGRPEIKPYLYISKNLLKNIK